MNKIDRIKSKFALLLTFALLLVFLSPAVQAKSLNNADINKMKGKQNKGVPTYKGKNSNNSSSIPGVPTIPGPPMVPGPAVRSGQGAVIVKKHLPYDNWSDEYRQYFQKHYREDDLKLKPKLIVMHYSGTDNFPKLWWTFVNGGPEGHLSVHYVIDRDGTIYELIPPDVRARGTYGVNHAAISIDLIGKNQNDILKNKKQLKVSFALVRYLMNKYRISKEKVLGHYEVARGKDLVQEYLDYGDSRYPDRYPPGSRGRGPGKAYMFKLRYYLNEK